MEHLADRAREGDDVADVAHGRRVEYEPLEAAPPEYLGGAGARNASELAGAAYTGDLVRFKELALLRKFAGTEDARDDL